jgi:hypothetical protein
MRTTYEQQDRLYYSEYIQETKRDIFVVVTGMDGDASVTISVAQLEVGALEAVVLGMTYAQYKAMLQPCCPLIMHMSKHM